MAGTSTTAIDEASVIDLARAGDQEAFTSLYERYYQRIYSYCYRIMVDQDDATDLAQSTFFKAWRGLKTVVFPRGAAGIADGFSAWLHRIASNGCLDVLRRRQRLRFLPWDGPKHDHYLIAGSLCDPEKMAVRQETRSLVRRILAMMTPRHRRALILREYTGLSCEAIGVQMHLTRSAVKSMLFRAREEFRRIFHRIAAMLAEHDQESMYRYAD